jgi:cytochrome c oxidase assembly protein subunit 15
MTLVLLYLLDRSRAPERVAVRGRILLAVMVAQGLIGYTQYFSHLPPLLVGFHVLGVTVLWTTFLWFYDGLFHHRPDPALPGGSAMPSAQALSSVGSGR